MKETVCCESRQRRAGESISMMWKEALETGSRSESKIVIAPRDSEYMAEASSNCSKLVQGDSKPSRAYIREQSSLIETW